MSTDVILVKESYSRCCVAVGFFDEFYATFLASSPIVRDKLKNTNLLTQKALLREGIAFLLMFASGGKLAQDKITALGKSHSKAHRDIAPSLYPLWVNALVRTVAKCDPKSNAQLEAAWRRVVGLGIAHMQSLYLKGG